MSKALSEAAASVALKSVDGVLSTVPCETDGKHHGGFWVGIFPPKTRLNKVCNIPCCLSFMEQIHTMPRKKCAYGFSCADMLMQPGLEPEDCPNAATCGTITSLSERERAELQIARMQNNRRIVEAVRITPNWAAVRLLNSRGCPQTSETIGLDASLANLSSAIERCRAELNELSTGYVAPIGVEAHRYLVKRPGANYQYNKLTSKDPLFPPQVKDQKVKVLHLSTDTDDRNITARCGIERRNRILQLKTQIEAATNLLEVAIEKVTETSIDEVVARHTLE